MGHYKADTPKRHYAYGNSKAIKKIDKGKLAGWKPKASKVVTAQHYVDKSGKKRYKGTKQLRSTEIYPMPFAREYADLLEDMKRTRPKFPEAPQDVPPAVVTFQQLDCADPSIWRHAHLAETFNYIRKSRRLRIPAEWQHLIPDKLDSVI